MPSKATLQYLNESCSECLAYEIYGISRGNKDIDFVNFKICFPEENFIIKVSEDVIKVSEHCVRIKRTNIIEEEDFYGLVFVKNNKKPLCWDLWKNPITSVEGKYISEEKDFKIRNEFVTRFVSGIVPNCHMP